MKSISRKLFALVIILEHFDDYKPVIIIIGSKMNKCFHQLCSVNESFCTLWCQCSNLFLVHLTSKGLITEAWILRVGENTNLTSFQLLISSKQTIKYVNWSSNLGQIFEVSGIVLKGKQINQWGQLNSIWTQ